MVAFEARYEDGYRYLDRCGEILVRVRQHSSAWVMNIVTPNVSQLQNAKNKFNMSFGYERLNVDIPNGVDLGNAEQVIEEFGRESEVIYGIVMPLIGVADTTRIGVRIRFSAPADNLEEADRFVARGAKSPLLTAVEHATGSNLRDARIAYILEDPNTGVHYRIEIISQLTPAAGEKLPTGLPGDTGTGAVCIDIDTYTRPSSGHFEKVGVHIQTSYLRSWTIAQEILLWLRQPHI